MHLIFVIAWPVYLIERNSLAKKTSHNKFWRLSKVFGWITMAQVAFSFYERVLRI